MKILLVEDDEFKANDILRVLADTYPNVVPDRAASMTSALRAINTGDFKLVILDMSLPTFNLSGPGGGGSPQGQGGLEVLRLAGELSSMSDYIIVTQYPDIEIDGKDIALNVAPKLLRSRFGVSVRGCILYEFDSDRWREPLRNVLKSVNFP